MPELTGIKVAKELAKRLPDPPVVICSMETDPEIVEAVRGTGAGYVFQARIQTELIAAAKLALRDNPLTVAV
jgi:DNA-binding NarL/FixJ family response regulator